MPRPKAEYKLDPKEELARLEEMTRLPEAIAETEAELKQINIDIESYTGILYTNFRKQRSKVVIKLARLERKLVAKNKEKAKLASSVNEEDE